MITDITNSSPIGKVVIQYFISSTITKDILELRQQQDKTPVRHHTHQYYQTILWRKVNSPKTGKKQNLQLSIKRQQKPPQQIQTREFDGHSLQNTREN